MRPEAVRYGRRSALDTVDPAARAGRPARRGLPGRAGWIRVFCPGGFGGGEGRRRPAGPPHLRGGGATGLRKPAPLRSFVGSRCLCVAYPKAQSNSPGCRLRGRSRRRRLAGPAGLSLSPIGRQVLARRVGHHPLRRPIAAAGVKPNSAAGLKRYPFLRLQQEHS